MKKIVLYALGALAVAALPACGGKKSAAAEQEQQPAKVLIRTSEAQEATVEQLVELTADIQPFKENQIIPAVSGVRIDRILVEVGDRVQKGQLLATMDPTQYNQALIQLKNLEADLARLTPVYEAGGISQQQLDQTRTQVDIQRDVVNNLKKNIELRAPITGVVTARNEEEGNLISTQPILELMQISPLKITANLSEQYFNMVKMGMPVEVRVDALEGRTFEGKVSLIYPALDASTRTFTVEVTLSNPKNELRPGMFARAVFNMGDRNGVLIPDTAIKRQAGTNDRVVFVIEGDSVARRRVVTLGRQIGDRVDVLSGVEPGEMVAVTSLTKLDEGSAVQVKND